MANIRVLKINYKTNIRGFKQNYQAYSLLNSDPSQTMQNKMREITTYLPNNSIFFTDVTEINKNDIGNDMESVLKNLTYDDRFNKILEKKYKENIRKNFGKYTPLTIAQAEEMRLIHKNIVTILDGLFAPKTQFYLTPTRPFTVMGYVWNPREYNTSNITYNRKRFKVYEISIILDLNPKQPDQISETELKKSECFNRGELIKQNFNHVFGDGTYLVKTSPAIEAPTATPSMLPGPGNINRPPVFYPRPRYPGYYPPPPTYYPPVTGTRMAGGGKNKKQKFTKRNYKTKAKTRKVRRA